MTKAKTMQTFNIIMPAKVYAFERTVTPKTSFNAHGYKFDVFAGNIWFDTKNLKGVIDDQEEYFTISFLTNYGYIRIESLVFYHKPSDEEFNVKLKDKISCFERIPKQDIDAFIGKQIAIISNAPKYEATQAIAIAERQKAIEQEKIEKEKAEAEKERIEQEKLEQDIIKAEQEFLNGKQISVFLFENLCEKHGININIRTKGGMRKGIVSIGKDNCRRSASYKGNGHWECIKQLAFALANHSL